VKRRQRGLELRTAQTAVPPEQAELRAQLSRATEGLTEVFEGLREISRGIHPVVLSRGGLWSALKTLARRSAVPVELDVGDCPRLPEPVEIAGYYVVSEALTNAAKHAQASVVHVDVAVNTGVLGLAIRDDGVGGADPARGSGLVGLRDRIDALRGRIEIESPAGGGTTLRVTIPHLTLIWRRPTLATVWRDVAVAISLAASSPVRRCAPRVSGCGLAGGHRRSPRRVFASGPAGASGVSTPCWLPAACPVARRRRLASSGCMSPAPRVTGRRLCASPATSL
jgi:hypothetical protein